MTTRKTSQLNRIAIVPAMLLIACTALTGAHGNSSGHRAADLNRASAAAKLASLAWMQGTWIKDDGKNYIEETWSEPKGDCMVGVLRWIKGGKVWMYELMAISIDNDKLVYRLRHFSREQTPWEKKDAGFAYPLTRITEGEVVFENPNRNQPRRFIYRRSGVNELIARLEGPEDGPNKGGSDYRFRRK